GVAVSVAHAHDLPADELMALVADSDVVHCVGPISATPAAARAHEPAAAWLHDAASWDARAFATLPGGPLLLVSQDPARTEASMSMRANHRLAAAAWLGGLNVLTCDAPADDADALEFMVAFYRELLHGEALAEAARIARSRLHRHGGAARLAALQPALYGDGPLVVFGKERHPRSEDNLRQVTIMSFDLVESTRLLNALGAERYSDLLAEYHKRCARIFEACGGTPDDPQGDDGAMCYFGFPVAREDAAVQALRAGFQIVEAVQRLGMGIRIGICTGQVVVREGQPVGAAIHFAARLQSIAAPSTIVVGDSTRRIVKERYRFEPLHQVARLKGFDEPEPCYRAVEPAEAPEADGSRGAAAVPAMTPFVGRGNELQSLEEHWAAVRRGALRLVRITGEPGIGKSRLVREFRKLLVADGHVVFECRCAPDHVDSAFQPLIESLRGQLRVKSTGDGSHVLERMRRLLSRADRADDESIALLAELLSIPLPAPRPELPYSAERRRQLTIELLIVLAQQRARQGAACMVVEDVHWIDPSTAEFMNRLANAARSLPLLIIATSRPEPDRRWNPRSAVHETELRGLSADLSRTLVLGVCGDARLPSEVVHLIALRADGVPLFIEESARMALELLESHAGATPTQALPVPTTIVDLLTARLDLLGAAKQLAQVGGTIGREFSLRLLQAVLADPGSPFPARDLQPRLAALIRSGMLVERNEGDDTRYRFKHSLMRDAAYRSLLERDRVRLHRVIAGVIGTQFAELAQRQPELLAFHFTEAGLDAEAVRAWESAARRAASSSAHAEAIRHVGSALAVLMRTPAEAARDRIELRLQLLLATRLIATDGYGADRVERVYGRAKELATALGDDAALMKVLLGLEGYHFMRADFAQAHTYAVDAAVRAQRNGAGAIYAVQSKWAVANILMHQGEMATAVRQMDDCRAEYERLEHRPEAVQDPGVMCLCYSAWSLWELGFPDEALRRVQTVVARAEQLKHKFSIGEAYGFRAAVQHFRGENEAAMESAQRAIDVCEDGGFAVWLAHARLMRGRVVAELHDPAAGIEEMRRAYEMWAATGAVVTTPFYLAMRAEGLAFGGRYDEGLELLEQALTIVNRCGERYYEAEVRRLMGRLTLQGARRAGLDRGTEAETWLLGALESANARQLRSLALRAALDLAELWLARGLRSQALEALQSAYRAIGEGRGTRDLMVARDRLQAMGGAAWRQPSAMPCGEEHDVQGDR
ncbi:MAG TPA: AAA family ATPase, partial [Albitalea sp.]